MTRRITFFMAIVIVQALSLDVLGADDDQAGVGLDTVYQQITTNVKSMTAMLTVVNDPSAEALQKSYTTYSENRSSCIKRHKLAAYACLENLSPSILEVTSTLNTLLSAGTTVAVNDACSNFAKAMTIAKAGMTAYTAECGLMKTNCGISCGSAKKGLEALQKALSGAATCKSPTTPCGLETYTKLKSSTAQLVAQELEVATVTSVAGKANICTGKYAALLVSAVTGIISVANSIKQGESCDEATSSSSTTDCTDSANAALPVCICEANPLLEGCSSIKTTTGAETLSAVSGESVTSSSTGLTAADLATDATTIDAGTGTSSSTGTSAVNGSSGGGATLGSSGGSSSGGSSDSSADGRKSTASTSVYSGTESGSGGRGGSGSNTSNSTENYRSYLPGGKNDPNRKLAGSSERSLEVTSQGGKSNWEKVRERYRDNRGSLLEY